MNKINHFEKVISCLPPDIRKEIHNFDNEILSSLEEIRIYKGRPVVLFASGKRLELKAVTHGEVISSILNNLMKFSYYAYEEDMAKGFITIDGGHRVGICGKAILDRGHVKLIREVSSLNIRYSKEVVGCSNAIKHLLFTDFSEKRTANNLLIVSPPGCGKTTLIRDIARCLSVERFKVGICDERSEITGMFNGKPSYAFGPMLDVIDGCPKAEGMIMLVRAMSPDVIITDEIGKDEDIRAIETCLNSGVSIVTTIHGKSLEDVKKGVIGPLIDRGEFKYIVFLTNIPQIGTVKEVIHG